MSTDGIGKLDQQSTIDFQKTLFGKDWALSNLDEKTKGQVLAAWMGIPPEQLDELLPAETLENSVSCHGLLLRDLIPGLGLRHPSLSLPAAETRPSTPPLGGRG